MNDTPENKEQLVNTGQNVDRNPDGTLMPGARLNPAGKPKGAKHFTTYVREALEEISKESGEPYIKLLAKKVLAKSIKEGDTQMIRTLWNYLDGMPQQFIDHTTGGEKIENTDAVAKGKAFDEWFTQQRNKPQRD